MSYENRVANGIASGVCVRFLTVSAAITLLLFSGACQSSRKPATPTRLVVSNQPLLDLSRGGAGIPLASRDLPKSASALQESLLSSYALRLVLPEGGSPIAVAGDALNALDLLRIDLSGGSVRPEYKPTQFAKRPTLQFAYSVKRFEYQASPIRLGKAEAFLKITADDAKLGLLANPDNSSARSVMMLTDARRGRMEFSMSPDDVNAALNSNSRMTRSSGGVSIQKSTVQFTSDDSRSLAGSVKVEGMWLILPFKMTIAGRVDFDSRCRACFTQLSAQGNDVTGSFLATFVQPMLEKYNGRVHPLVRFPGNRMSVRDVRINLTDTLNVTVDFGSRDTSAVASRNR